MKKKALKKPKLNSRVANQVRNPRLIETIQLKNGRFMNIDFHTIRFNFTRERLFGISEKLDLKNEIIVPNEFSSGIQKCRVTYNDKIVGVEFEPYISRSIQSLKIVTDNDIEYNYKYADRSQINSLLSLKGSCDDIIISKNGLLTDTSYSNIAVWNGKNWLTPAIPLLYGTARARLLKEKKIIENKILTSDIQRFEKIRMFNAMIDFSLPIDNTSIIF